jgi:transketolase C-terminal domain/subunit
MMSHIDLNWDFSQFDRDNMNRYMAAAFAHSANVIAADILADPDPDAGRAADEAASFLAKRAYDLVRKGARQAGVAVVGSHDGWQVDEPGSAAARLDDATTVDHLGPRSHRLRR